ncbi:hypothetical protein [Flavimaricola marinus]|uniref:Uncharacterized protein n=1 Tax=Flavimaricola marinus TaxID=1819565 RepID=A0A238LA74_9RHOB|nr:hypothetical protein [Flavimaricola marinus]SMY06482.1 hypothetical protein LOM8899_00607 [Flavimaricola marinus]
MPRIVNFYILHCVIGFAIAAAFTGAILWFNVANLWHLVSTSSIGMMAVIAFWVLNGIVFAGVQFAIAIMLLADKDDEPRGGTAVPVRVAAPAPVPVKPH